MSEQGEWVDSGTRPRNILTLEERVRALREFEITPVYQKVADIMNCSAKQIRNIVCNRESILLYYASKTGDCQGVFSKHKDRQQKIDLLNRVMYEWIQRTQSREDIGRITTKLIRTIALDVKNHLKVPSFYPNNVWLDSFMETYDMTENDLMCQNIYNRSNEPKEHLSLKISDIVDDVKAMDESVFRPYENKKRPQVKDVKGDSSRNSFLSENSNSRIEESADDDYDEVQVVIEKSENEDDDDNDDVDGAYSMPPAKLRKVETFHTDSTDGEDGGEKTIESYEEALRHLKPLEDFVLLEENFRAIGVISQLEAIFKNPNRSEND